MYDRDVRSKDVRKTPRPPRPRGPPPSTSPSRRLPPAPRERSPCARRRSPGTKTRYSQTEEVRRNGAVTPPRTTPRRSRPAAPRPPRARVARRVRRSTRQPKREGFARFRGTLAVVSEAPSAEALELAAQQPPVASGARVERVVADSLGECVAAEHAPQKNVAHRRRERAGGRRPFSRVSWPPTPRHHRAGLKRSARATRAYPANERGRALGGVEAACARAAEVVLGEGRRLAGATRASQLCLGADHQHGHGHPPKPP